MLTPFNFMDETSLPIVGHLNGEPIYAVSKAPAEKHVCKSNPNFPCLACILNELNPVLEKLEVNMERTYQELMQLQEIRIDDGTTELHVNLQFEQLRTQLAVASCAHNTLFALLGAAKIHLQ